MGSSVVATPGRARVETSPRRELISSRTQSSVRQPGQPRLDPTPSPQAPSQGARDQGVQALEASWLQPPGW